MTGAVAPAAVNPAAELVWFERVLAGVALAGPAAELAGRLDPGFLTEAGWDPVSRVLSPPAEHPLLGRAVCRVGGCTSTAHGGRAGIVCSSCRARLTGQGLSGAQIAAMDLPPLPDCPAGCAVPGCRRMPPSPRARLCVSHSRQFHRRAPGTSVEQFAADPRIGPLPMLGPCQVAACDRRTEWGQNYCPSHYQRWRSAVASDADTDRWHWQATQSAVAEGGRVSLRGLPPLVVTEVLFAAQQRVRGGAKIYDATLRAVCDTLRRGQAPTISDCPVESVPGKPARALLAAMARDVRRALTDPARERAGDNWDLAVFGHRGRLSFTGISQPWLARAAKAWAGEELPRHRGGGGGNVREKVRALARLSESLRARDDHGLAPDLLARKDIEVFLNRLAYLESTGAISRYHRNVICRDTRYALSGIRALGLTRPGQVAAGLPGDFALGRGDIPAEPARGEPGRDLPPEIMAVLCAHLDSLHPVEVRTATQIGIDTGHGHAG